MNKNITIVIVDCVEPEKADKVLDYCAEQFNCKKKILFTHQKTGINSIKISKIESIIQYNEFILKELYKYIDTEFCLVVQTDGFILNPNQWTDEFLQYDYIGAPLSDYPIWIAIQPDEFKSSLQAGGFTNHRWPMNGGFSLRSKTLLELTARCPIPIDSFAEDMYISLYFRSWFEDQGMKFPSKSFAYTFSHENPIIDHSFNFDDCFGFHGKFSPKQQELLKIPENSNSGINRYLKHCISINPAVSLARYLKLWFKEKVLGLQRYDDIYEFYIESIKSTSKVQKRYGEIDLIIFHNSSDLFLLENIVSYARKNIRHTIKNCFIISDNHNELFEFCTKHNCTAIDNQNKKYHDLNRLSTLGKNEYFCVIQDNTIIIKDISLFIKKVNTVFFDIEKGKNIPPQIIPLFRLKDQLPISFNSSVLSFNKKKVASFLAKFESELSCNDLDFKTQIELFYSYELQNNQHSYKLKYLFQHQRNWIGQADFFIDLYEPSVTKIITFRYIN
jgi:hypothetical protein